MRRLNLESLDPRDPGSPRRGRLVDHREQPRVDAVPVRQEVVEHHRAHDSAAIRHGEVEDGAAKVSHLVGRPGGLKKLEEKDPIHPDHGVVTGDDLLLGNVEQGFHQG